MGVEIGINRRYEEKSSSRGQGRNGKAQEFRDVRNMIKFMTS